MTGVGGAPGGGGQFAIDRRWVTVSFVAGASTMTAVGGAPGGGGASTMTAVGGAPGGGGASTMTAVGANVGGQRLKKSILALDYGIGYGIASGAFPGSTMTAVGGAGSASQAGGGEIFALPHALP